MPLLHHAIGDWRVAYAITCLHFLMCAAMASQVNYRVGQRVTATSPAASAVALVAENGQPAPASAAVRPGQWKELLRTPSYVLLCVAIFMWGAFVLLAAVPDADERPTGTWEPSRVSAAGSPRSWTMRCRSRMRPLPRANASRPLGSAGFVHTGRDGNQPVRRGHLLGRAGRGPLRGRAGCLVLPGPLERHRAATGRLRRCCHLGGRHRGRAGGAEVPGGRGAIWLLLRAVLPAARVPGRGRVRARRQLRHGAHRYSACEAVAPRCHNRAAFHVAVHVRVCVPRRQVSGIGGAVLPFVQGLVSDDAGLRLSMLTASVSGALGVVVMLMFRCMTRHTLLAPQPPAPPTELANAPASGGAEMSL
jgi:hypothetical protein